MRTFLYALVLMSTSWALMSCQDTVVIDDTVVCMDCDHERELEW